MMSKTTERNVGLYSTSDDDDDVASLPKRVGMAQIFVLLLAPIVAAVMTPIDYSIDLFRDVINWRTH